jgi:hypothetical protein
VGYTPPMMIQETTSPENPEALAKAEAELDAVIELFQEKGRAFLEAGGNPLAFVQKVQAAISS